MQGYMQGVQEWSGVVLSDKDRSGGGSECHVTHDHDNNITTTATMWDNDRDNDGRFFIYH